MLEHIVLVDEYELPGVSSRRQRAVRQSGITHEPHGGLRGVAARRARLR